MCHQDLDVSRSYASPSRSVDLGDSLVGPPINAWRSPCPVNHGVGTAKEADPFLVHTQDCPARQEREPRAQHCGRHKPPGGGIMVVIAIDEADRASHGAPLRSALDRGTGAKHEITQLKDMGYFGWQLFDDLLELVKELMCITDERDHWGNRNAMGKEGGTGYRVDC